MVDDAFYVYATAVKHLVHLRNEMSACGVDSMIMNSRTLEYTKSYI
jgi:hypothetical protein